MNRRVKPKKINFFTVLCCEKLIFLVYNTRIIYNKQQIIRRGYFYIGGMEFNVRNKERWK